jgi:hypothetical protein
MPQADNNHLVHTKKGFMRHLALFTLIGTSIFHLARSTIGRVVIHRHVRAVGKLEARKRTAEAARRRPDAMSGLRCGGESRVIRLCRLKDSRSCLVGSSFQQTFTSRIEQHLPALMYLFHSQLLV